MATVAVIVGAAVINAICFTAGNALYDKFGRTDGSAERERHDKAVEDLQKASVEWNQKRLDILDFINNSTKEKNEARDTFEDVDRALDFYNQTHPDGQIVVPPKPVFRDFYKPSVEQNYYETLVATAIGGVFGYLAFRIIK